MEEATRTELEIQKAEAMRAFKTATSDVVRRELEKDVEQLEARINGSSAEHTKLKIAECDIDAFMEYAKSIMEHPAKALLNTVNTRQQESLYSVVFDELPTIEQMANGTPKLSWVFRLSEDSGHSKSVLAGPAGFEPAIAVLETAVLPLKL